MRNGPTWAPRIPARIGRYMTDHPSQRQDVSRREPRRPDFFIVGAPKSGTTALYEYLRQHPEVYMAEPKEPNFFGADLERRRTPRISQDEYLAYFVGAGAAKRVGEASVRYLHSRSAATEIAEFAPGGQAIIMLRDPVEMMYAMHAELVFIGAEDIEDFGQALVAEDDRRRGLRIPRGANKPAALFYRESARFAEQVERYFAALGRDRVLVIIYDSFRDDTLGTYRTVLRFLGIDEGFTPELRVVNPSKQPRSRLLTRLVSNPPAWARRLAATALPPRQRKRLFRRALALNARTAPRRPMDPELRRRLKAEFAPEVQRLGALIGRDLSAWSE
jgi:hypothetical protein